MPTETRYLRSDTNTVNSLTARKLGTDLAGSVSSEVYRTGVSTASADLDSSLYECKFWVRDEMNNIYGPYIGIVVKKDSKEYYATYDFDPTETFLLGYYDIRVEVTKYG
jgi:hypothetical protein